MIHASKENEDGNINFNEFITELKIEAKRSSSIGRGDFDNEELNEMRKEMND